jgi:hypothetical protein
MATLRTIASFALLLLAGCSSGPTVSLDQIQQKRVFALTRVSTVDAIRFFTVKEGFKVDSIEDETGRFIAHRVNAARGSESRTVIMNVKVFSVDDGHTEVHTRFTFSQLSQTPSKEEEGILVDCYMALYQTLESASN